MSLTISLKDEGPVRLVTMASTSGLNVFVKEDRRRLESVLLEADRDASIRVVVLRGSDRSFSVGANMNEFPVAPCDPTDYVRSVLLSSSLPERMDKPVLAVVDGTAVAGGFELALSCDWIFAEAQATFALPEARFGLVAGYAIARLCANIGPARTRRLLITGETMSADELVQFGLHLSVTAPGEALSGALSMAREICLASPHAVREVKRRTVAFGAAADPELEESLAAYAELWNLPETVEAFAAFRHRGKARAERRGLHDHA